MSADMNMAPAMSTGGAALEDVGVEEEKERREEEQSRGIQHSGCAVSSMACRREEMRRGEMGREK